MKGKIRKYAGFLIVGVIAVGIVIILMSLIFKEDYGDDSISFNYLSDNEEIVVSNSLPMTDEVGKNISASNYKSGITEYVEFEVKSNVSDKVKYEIYLTKEDLELEVPVKFVKVYLTDSDDVALKYFDESQVPTFYDLRLADTNPSGKLLYSGTLKSNESKKFVLRMWVADTYALTPEKVSFSAKLHVKVK